ncbi:MAG: hypothetical protein ABR910_01545 [Acidobacteriaceae bacterium]|jgi:hypothetical protein
MVRLRDRCFYHLVRNAVLAQAVGKQLHTRTLKAFQVCAQSFADVGLDQGLIAGEP